VALDQKALARLAVAALIGATAVLAQSPPPAARRPQPAAPRRIISVVPAVTEMLFAIGAGNEVVGVSSFDHYPPAVETRPRVGALIDPDFEKILSLRPDLVVVYGTQTDFKARLERAHIPTFNYVHAGLDDVMTTIRALGARIGRAEQANREADRIASALAAIRASSAGRPRPRTALVFNRDAGSLRGLFVAGGSGFLNDMLDVAGGTNVFADVHQSSMQASTEALIARAPDVILELRQNEGWSPERVRQELDVWKGLSSLPAVRNGRVHILADDKLLVPGPRVAEGIQLMADAIRKH
jgi:iron complex transport system substrate-binding protein